jgi:hypothetical protein
MSDLNLISNSFTALAAYATKFTAQSKRIDSSISICGGFIDMGENLELVITNKSKSYYHIFASTSSPKDRIGLQIFDPTGAPALSLNPEDGGRSTDYTLKDTAEMTGKWKVKLHNLNKGDLKCFISLVICREAPDGKPFNVRNLKLLGQNLATALKPAVKNGAQFDFNEPCLYGAFVGSNAPFAMTPVSLARPSNWVVGASDGRAGLMRLGAQTAKGDEIFTDNGEEGWPASLVKGPVRGAKFTMFNTSTAASLMAWVRLKAK